MKINKVLATACLICAFVGFGAAYGLGALHFASESGLLYVASRKQNSFGETFDKLAHLGTIEYAAANCSGTGNVQTVLKNETEMLALLTDENKHRDAESLPLAAAQARLAARELITSGAQSSSGDRDLVERARALAVSAGWNDPSETHLHQIIEALDKDICKAPTGGTISQ
jgi:hypothetical protein